MLSIARALMRQVDAREPPGPEGGRVSESRGDGQETGRADLAAELRSLEGLSVPALVARHRELFGRDPRSRNRESLVRRIAWRLQEQTMGGLSGAARRRLAELQAEIDLGAPAAPRRGPGRTVARPGAQAPGTVLVREWRGQTVEVRVREDGAFEHAGEVYRSLSAVARAVTGTRWNGKLFFGLVERKRGTR